MPLQTSQEIETDIAILGAGVAGCAAALALSRQGFRVALLERAKSLQSRFCGEFVSGEVASMLERLDVAEQVREVGANPVRCLELHPTRGRPLKLPLAMGGFGLSRRALDGMLLERAVAEGATLFAGTQVTTISGTPNAGFRVRAVTSEDRACVFSARAVIGAHGKRSSVDRLLGRSYRRANSTWIGVRKQFHGADLADAVALYLFPGGYCGAITTEAGSTTLALLAHETTLKACGGRPEGLIEHARMCNPALRNWLDNAKPVPDSLLTISRISFAPKQPVVEGVFMAGDSATVMPPFLGVGIASALGSALACSEAVGGWLRGDHGPEQARGQYERWWQRGDNVRKLSRPASWLLCRPPVGNTAIGLLNGIPAVARAIYGASRVTAPPAATGSELSRKPAGRTERLSATNQYANREIVG